MHHKGFTMIEMVFVLSLTLIISSLCCVYHPVHIREENEIMMIRHCFDIAHVQALAYKEKVTVNVTSKTIDVSSAHYSNKIGLNQSYKFLTSHSFTYNSMGHIKTAKTLSLQTPDHVLKFVFQVGSGIYYVT